LLLRIELTISLKPEDAERLIQAFNEGKLAELGVLDIIQVTKPGTSEVTGKSWASAEGEKREALRQDDFPFRK